MRTARPFTPFVHHGIAPLPIHAPADGARPLDLAIVDERTNAALYLINEAPGCDINGRAIMVRPPLMLAAGAGLLDMVKALMKRGADVNAVETAPGPPDAPDTYRISALAEAVIKRHEEVTVYLVEASAALDGLINEISMLDIATTRSMLLLIKAIARRMRQDGLDDAAIGKQLLRAAASGIESDCTVAAIQELQEEGLDVTQPLVEMDADGKVTRYVHNLLFMAAEGSNKAVASHLFTLGLDPRARDLCGFMPHHIATVKGSSMSMLQFFVTRANVPVDAELTGDHSGGTALHAAAVYGREEMAKWLIEAGADPRKLGRFGKNNQRRRPAEVAELNGHASLARYLKRQEAAAAAGQRVGEQQGGGDAADGLAVTFAAGLGGAFK